MKRMQPGLSAQKGFTLIELMIVVAIVGILAAIALPAYQQYTLKAKFAEVVTSTAAIKTGIELCVQQGDCTAAGAIANVAFGFNGIIPIAPVKSTYLASVAVNATGTITATATGANGLGGETYILVPTLLGDGKVTWALDQVNSTCWTRAGGKIC